MACRLQKGFCEGSAGQKCIFAQGFSVKIALFYNCSYKASCSQKTCNLIAKNNYKTISSFFTENIVKQLVSQHVWANTQENTWFCTVFERTQDKTTGLSTFLRKHAIKHGFSTCLSEHTDTQSRYAIQICNTDTQWRYATKICNTDMQYRYAIQICNTDK